MSYPFYNSINYNSEHSIINYDDTIPNLDNLKLSCLANGKKYFSDGKFIYKDENNNILQVLKIPVIDVSLITPFIENFNKNISFDNEPLLSSGILNNNYDNILENKSKISEEGCKQMTKILTSTYNESSLIILQYYWSDLSQECINKYKLNNLTSISKYRIIKYDIENQTNKTKFIEEYVNNSVDDDLSVINDNLVKNNLELDIIRYYYNYGTNLGTTFQNGIFIDSMINDDFLYKKSNVICAYNSINTKLTDIILSNLVVSLREDDINYNTYKPHNNNDITFVNYSNELIQTSVGTYFTKKIDNMFYWCAEIDFTQPENNTLLFLDKINSNYQCKTYKFKINKDNKLYTIFVNYNLQKIDSNSSNINYPTLYKVIILECDLDEYYRENNKNIFLLNTIKEGNFTNNILVLNDLNKLLGKKQKIFYLTFANLEYSDTLGFRSRNI